MQANAIASTVFEVFTVEKSLSGIIISIAVGLVILGGVKRIGFIASRLVPLMVIVYVLLCLFVIIKNIDSILHFLLHLTKRG